MTTKADSRLALALAPVHACAKNHCSSRSILSRRLLLGAVLPCVACASGLANAPSSSIPTRILVDATKLQSPVPPTGIGVNVGVFDEFLDGPNVPVRLKTIGTNVLRFPDGTPSDKYHWRDHRLTPNTIPDFWLAPNATFDNFMALVHKSSAQALITVNYGTNADGTQGGDPAEAAAWVKEANVVRKLGISHWEIGNEIWGNGSYGAHWTPDAHQDKSPSGYAREAARFIDAMRAEDPTIRIGIPAIVPFDWPDGLAPDWNRTVIGALCPRIDFVSVHWYPQQGGSESDPDLLASPAKIVEPMQRLRALLVELCGQHAAKVSVWVTEMNSTLPPGSRQQLSIVAALFTADAYLTWFENGAANVTWEALHNGPQADKNDQVSGTTDYGDWGLLANGTCSDYMNEHWPRGGKSNVPPCTPPRDTPYPAWHALHLLSKFARPGDTSLAALSANPLLAVHAARRADGRLSVLLINKSATDHFNGILEFTGFVPSGSGELFKYGRDSAQVTGTRFSASEPQIAVWIPPYTMSALVLDAFME